jgi:hypothetical protein
MALKKEVICLIIPVMDMDTLMVINQSPEC